MIASYRAEHPLLDIQMVADESWVYKYLIQIHALLKTHNYGEFEEFILSLSTSALGADKCMMMVILMGIEF
jgi:hypothetical protein